MTESFRVECEAGPEGSRVPARVGLHGAMQRVARVLDRWPGADHCYFRVRTEAGDLWILRHDERAGTWELVFYRRG